MRRFAVPLALLLSVVLAVGVVQAADPDQPRRGSAGIGDPYFPLDGNGGYDVRHYDLDLRYEPDTDILKGTATISAKATHALSRFNLDYDGPEITSVRVDDRKARFKRQDGELIITPARSIAKGKSFTVVVRYEGIPTTLGDQFGGGWTHTDDGAFVAGQPHGATTWFPANDHPVDKASLTVKVNVPKGTEAVSNGRLVRATDRGSRSIWTWDAKEPMASYLAVLMIGQFDIDRYRANDIRFWDAIDPDLFTPVAAPTTGTQFAITQQADLAYKRLGRTLSVPAAGATLSFVITHETEFPWDFVFVEAHTPGLDDWTTLPEVNGLNTQEPWTCPYALPIHPFLAHYLTEVPNEGCLPTGSIGTPPGEWWAATGSSGGPQTWTIDLARYAGQDVEVAITYMSDDIIQMPGVFVDDIVVSTGEGSTSFEADGDVMDGWAVLGPPADSPGNVNDWIVGTAADVPPPQGETIRGSFARQPEIIETLGGWFGRYPFSTGGGIVDDLEGVGFALETQTRPIYARDFFTDPLSGDNVLVHELAHQWYGDSLAVKRWQHIWLNEGFATYAEWLWSEDQGLGTAQEIYDSWWEAIPPEEYFFWALTIGDPGPDQLFDFAVYIRGAMTLHALRTAVGDADFFEILETWAARNKGGLVTTSQFIRLAERISGQQLDDLFDAWLFTGAKPGFPPPPPPPPDPARIGVGQRLQGGSLAIDLRHAPVVVRSQLERYGGDLAR